MRKFTKDWLINWVRELPANMKSFAERLDEETPNEVFPVWHSQPFPFSLIYKSAYMTGLKDGLSMGYKGAASYTRRMIGTWIDGEDID